MEIVPKDRFFQICQWNFSYYLPACHWLQIATRYFHLSPPPDASRVPLEPFPPRLPAQRARVRAGLAAPCSAALCRGRPNRLAPPLSPTRCSANLPTSLDRQPHRLTSTAALPASIDRQAPRLSIPMARVASPPPSAPTPALRYGSPPSTSPQSPPQHLPSARHGELRRLGFTTHGIQWHDAVVSRIQQPESSPYAARRRCLWIRWPMPPLGAPSPRLTPPAAPIMSHCQHPTPPSAFELKFLSNAM
jgi:hypothetical protein